MIWVKSSIWDLDFDICHFLSLEIAVFNVISDA